jgi:hypothetical protein
VAEVARVEDDLDVFVPRRDLAQDGDGAVLRRVVDEEMLVAIAADLGEDLLHLLVAFADVVLLVVATADHRDQLVPGRQRGRNGGGDAGGETFQNSDPQAMALSEGRVIPTKSIPKPQRCTVCCVIWIC